MIRVQSKYLITIFVLNALCFNFLYGQKLPTKIAKAQVNKLINCYKKSDTLSFIELLLPFNPQGCSDFRIHHSIYSTVKDHLNVIIQKNLPITNVLINSEPIDRTKSDLNNIQEMYWVTLTFEAYFDPNTNKKTIRGLDFMFYKVHNSWLIDPEIIRSEEIFN